MIFHIEDNNLSDKYIRNRVQSRGCRLGPGSDREVRVRHRSECLDDDVAVRADVTRSFVVRGALPHRARWAGQGVADRNFWRAAGDVSPLCPSVSEAYGGGSGTLAHDLVVFRAPLVLAENGFGIGNAVHGGGVAHHVLAYGAEQQKQRGCPVCRMAPSSEPSL